MTKVQYSILSGVAVGLFLVLALFSTARVFRETALHKRNEIQGVCFITGAQGSIHVGYDPFTEFTWPPDGKKVSFNSAGYGDTHPYMIYWILLVIAILDVALIIYKLRKIPKDKRTPEFQPHTVESVQAYPEPIELKKEEEKLLVYAEFWRRFLAFLIDDLLMSAVFVLCLWIAVTHQLVMILFAVFLIRWMYFAGMESSQAQGTIGKIIFSIIVTDVKGNRISFEKATLRFLSKILSQILFFGGYAMAVFTEKKQGLHDKIAGTLVLMKDIDIHAEYKHPLYVALEPP